jgi:hypothetical protein
METACEYIGEWFARSLSRFEEKSKSIKVYTIASSRAECINVFYYLSTANASKTAE